MSRVQVGTASNPSEFKLLSIFLSSVWSELKNLTNFDKICKYEAKLKNKTKNI